MRSPMNWERSILHTTKARRPTSQRNRLLRVESLESRMLLAMFTASATPVAPMPETGWAFSGAMIDDTLHVIGGENTTCGHRRDHYVYNTNSDTWSSTPADMTVPRMMHDAVAMDDKLYAISGQTSCTWITTAHVEAYEPATNAWTTLSSIPKSLTSYAAIAVEDKIYVFGGNRRSGNDKVVNRDTYIYDPVTDSWADGTAFPEIPGHPRAVPIWSAALVGDEVYVPVGNLDVDNGNGYFLYSYNVDNDTWTYRAESPIQDNGNVFGGPHLFNIGQDVGIVMDGEDNGVVDIHVFSTDNQVWQDVDTSQVSFNGWGHVQFVPFDSGFYVLGGKTGGVPTNATNAVQYFQLAHDFEAVDDAYLMYGDDLSVTAETGVLSNDSGDSLTARLITGPTHDADFSLNPDGSFIYTPGPDFGGTDSFTYVANDGTGDSEPATVTIRHALYVTNTNNSGEGSLRWTMNNANTHANDPSCPDTIRFAIPGTGVQTIQPLSALPKVTDPVVIDGWSQPGFSDTPIIELDGSSVGSAYGLWITAGSSAVRGLVIHSFGRVGIRLSGAGSNLVQGNYIGSDPSGMLPIGGLSGGVEMDSGSSWNCLGTDGDGIQDNLEGNIIAASEWMGLTIRGDGTDHNVAAGNLIGVDTSGTGTIGGNANGVLIKDGAQYNLIGTNGDGRSDELERNIISGNGWSEVTIATGGTDYNVVAGNYIGTDPSGRVALGGNGNGVTIERGACNNLIGSHSSGMGSAAERNVIAGNAGNGICIQDAGTNRNRVTGNFLGTDATGTVALANRSGVVILDGAQHNLIGTDGDDVNDAFERNVISGNTWEGIAIANAGTEHNVVAGNYIGTDVTGAADLGNGHRGVRMEDGASYNLIGTNGDGVADIAERNIISGNNKPGVQLTGATVHDNVVAGNFIGTDVTGTAAIENNHGVGITNGANHNLIGTDGDGVADDVEGNLMSGNRWTGVMILGIGSDNNVVAGNLIGTDATGVHPIGNRFAGTNIAQGASHNLIGTNGDGAGDAAERNVLSGNVGYGVRICHNGSDYNVVAGNLIGTDISGTAPLANTTYGVSVQEGAKYNRIGTDGDGTADEAERNVISGNHSDGVSVTGTGTDQNTVAGNYLGLDASGTVALGNGIGGVVFQSGAMANRLGTDADGEADELERNVVSGNLLWGVRILDSDHNVVAGNFIGTDATGTAAIGNTTNGVAIYGGSESNLVGTNADGTNDDAERNVISGNPHSGVIIGGADTKYNMVAGNFIGTDPTGMIPLANRGGVAINDGAQSNIIGTNGDGEGDEFEGNIISGNHSWGVLIVGSGSDLNVVAGNDIGTDVTGSLALGNGYVGVLIQDEARENRIGTDRNGVADLAERNVISGNGTDGVRIEDAGSDNNIVAGNFVGTDVTGTLAIGNTGSGVLVDNAVSTLMEHNIVTGNGGNGIQITGSTAVNNTIRANSIHSNAGLGIDLGDDGPTPNDPGDGDSGPNMLQNFPEMQLVQADANPRIQGSLDSTPDTTFTLDFYANAEPTDPADDVEGQRYLGSVLVTTDSAGLAEFDVTLPVAAIVNEVVTATATGPTGNTSEFSPAEKAGLPVEVDLKPGSGTNSVSLNGNGMIAIAMLTTEEFDAASIDVTTVQFAGAAVRQSALEDVDGDGDLDMVLHFRISDTNLMDIYAELLAEDINEDGTLDSNHQIASVSLTGETLADEYFKALDDVDLFLSGRKLRDLLDELAEDGII